MRKIVTIGCALAAALAVASTAFAAQCNTPPPAWWNAPRVTYTTNGVPNERYSRAATHEFAAQRRPEVTIYPRKPRHLRASARRYCEAHLVQEFRVSGPVVVPRQRCWWR